MNLIRTLRKPIKQYIWLFGLFSLVICGCSQVGSMQNPTYTVVEGLTPYLKTTSSPIADQVRSTESPKPSSTHIPTPTSTPFVYEVVENDTLIGIANRYSVPLEELIAANPGIDPNFLTIGLTLTIPIEGVIASVMPTSIPISIKIQPPICYPLSDGYIDCMSVVENDQAFDLENVTVMMSLESSSGDELNEQIGILPLNIIPQGQKAAVTASFGSPIQHNFIARANLLSAIPVSPDDHRYLKTDLKIDEIFISPDGLHASITGAVMIPSEQLSVSTVWVSAFAYDGQNNIVGIRKWVADDIMMNSNNQVNFKMYVYSLGSPIDYVDVLTEVRP